MTKKERDTYNAALDMIILLGREIVRNKSLSEAESKANGDLDRVVIPPHENQEIVRRLTAAMREADRTFETVGGSAKHHVRDCLLPILEKHGLKIEAV